MGFASEQTSLYLVSGIPSVLYRLKIKTKRDWSQKCCHPRLLYSTEASFNACLQSWAYSLTEHSQGWCKETEVTLKNCKKQLMLLVNLHNFSPFILIGCMCIENCYAQSKDQKLFSRKVIVEQLFLKQYQYCLRCRVNWKCNTSGSNALGLRVHIGMQNQVFQLLQLVSLSLSMNGQTTCDRWFSNIVEYLPIWFWISGTDKHVAQLRFRNVFSPVKETGFKGQINAHLHILCMKGDKAGYEHL